MKPIVALFVLAASEAAFAGVPDASASYRPTIRLAVDRYFESFGKSRKLVFLRRTDRREYDSSGAVRSRLLATTRTDFVEGVRLTWTVARDDKPLPPDELARTNENVRAFAAEWKNKPESEKKAFMDKAYRKQDDDLAYLREFADALDFRPAPNERLAGRDTLVFDFFPRSSYSPRKLQGRVYEKVRGRIWIDAAETQVARLHAEVFDDVSLGGFLARVAKGTQFQLDQVRVQQDLWAARYQLIRFDVKVLLVKEVHRWIESTWSEITLPSGTVLALRDSP
jgi:hypothetical protein